ncbi:MAG: phospholipid carrier-dependent glycosyltransferase [Cyanobacteria bacterium]|nr:phospholipid carrier-dependent glycosyltransferase [Cyanobacteriota bacterium]MDW8201105.1 phospholipid carrier-dependent glycosyltransferase [Cyanobacteriota bacterium SKYGB_h_bin112]
MAKTHVKSAFPSFQIALGLLLLLSLALRFWGLGRFNMLVFDEVYYAKFANNYLTQTPFFDGHPPLSKYLIAIGIWIGNRLPIGQDTVNTLTGSTLSTFSYRWLNALLGSLIPLVVAGIAYQISYRRSFALLAGYFTALDGLLLVESRYALNNVHLLLFGLLGHWCLLLAVNPRVHQQLPWLILSGINFGCSIAIKWNGLWFLLGVYAIWAIAWIVRFFQHRRPRHLSVADQLSSASTLSVADRLTQLSLPKVMIFLGVLPVVIYSLLWIPHLTLSPDYNFVEVHQQILSYHQRIGGMTPYADPNCTPWHKAFFTKTLSAPLCIPKIHPYCSPWLTWIFMLRPVVYLYETARNTAEPIPVNPPPSPSETQVVYDVHAMGNPILWWASSIAIVILLVQLGQRLWRQAVTRTHETTMTPLPTSEQPVEKATAQQPVLELWSIGYMLVNYAANLLPWVRVSRCAFLYHYMGAGVFATLALAWCCDQWLHGDQDSRINTLMLIVFIILAFIFWLPLYLGLPLSPEAAQLRRLLPTW